MKAFLNDNMRRAVYTGKNERDINYGQTGWLDETNEIFVPDGTKDRYRIPVTVSNFYFID
jgi:hypothetical protein